MKDAKFEEVLQSIRSNGLELTDALFIDLDYTEEQKVIALTEIAFIIDCRKRELLARMNK